MDGIRVAIPFITMQTRKNDVPTLPAQLRPAVIDGNLAVDADAYARESQAPTTRAPALRNSGAALRRDVPERVIVGRPLDPERADRISDFVERYSRRPVAGIEAGLLEPSEIPVLLLAPETYPKPPMDLRSQFVMSLIDGFSSVELIVAQSGMPPQDAVYALCDLVNRGLIHLV